MPEELRRMNANDMKREMSPEMQAELRRLSERSDEDIDTSDIPELTEEQWASARRGSQFRPVKTPVTIRLDADVIAWLRETARDGR